MGGRTRRRLPSWSRHERSKVAREAARREEKAKRKQPPASLDQRKGP